MKNVRVYIDCASKELKNSKTKITTFLARVTGRLVKEVMGLIAFFYFMIDFVLVDEERDGVNIENPYYYNIDS